MRQSDTTSVTPGVRRRPDAVWRLRRSPLARAALLWVAKICLALLAVVFLITVFFVWAFGHPVAWSVIGCLFGALPLAGLVATIGVGLRAAVTAGPGRIAIRFFGRWRVVDLGQVRAVRLGDQGPFGGMSGFATFGGPGRFGGPGGFGGFGGFGGSGPFGSSGPGSGSAGPGSGGAGGFGGQTLVFEDVHGQRVQIGVDALEAGLAAVVREGLGADVEIDAGAARALGRGPGPDDGTDLGTDLGTNHRDGSTGEPDAGPREQGNGPRP